MTEPFDDQISSQNNNPLVKAFLLHFRPKKKYPARRGDMKAGGRVRKIRNLPQWRKTFNKFVPGFMDYDAWDDNFSSGAPLDHLITRIYKAVPNDVEFNLIQHKHDQHRLKRLECYDGEQFHVLWKDEQ